MICQKCGQKSATVHITKLSNNQKLDLHLCEDCASKMNSIIFVKPSTILNTDLAIPMNLISGILNANKNETYKPYHEEVKKCDKCNMTYDSFIKNGKFGCINCYKVFNNSLDEALKKIHGSKIYKGRLPQKAKESVKVKREINELKSDLKRLIEEEKYELAANVRDEIKSLQKQLKEEGNE